MYWLCGELLRRPSRLDREAVEVVNHPYDAARMKMTPANPAVGNWRNNGPEDVGSAQIEWTQC